MATSAESYSSASAQLLLLRRFELRCGNGALTLPLGAQRLLAFLAVHELPLLRSYVAEALWPDSNRRRASASLRSALWRIRGQAECLVEATNGQLSLGPQVQVDLRDLTTQARRLLDRTSEGDAIDLGRDSVAGFSAALLPDWFDEWLLLERDRWNQLRMYALEAMAEHLLQAGRLVEAVEAALAAVSAEPLRESANRVLIKVYAAEGNWSSAMAQYRRYRQLLTRELKSVPSAQMEELIRVIAPR